MPRFLFHLFDDEHTIDAEGKDFPNVDAARNYAIGCARGMMAEDLKVGGKINLSHWIEIEDDQGEMDVVPFGLGVVVTR